MRRRRSEARCQPPVVGTHPVRLHADERQVHAAADRRLRDQAPSLGHAELSGQVPHEVRARRERIAPGDPGRPGGSRRLGIGTDRPQVDAPARTRDRLDALATCRALRKDQVLDIPDRAPSAATRVQPERGRAWGHACEVPSPEVATTKSERVSTLVGRIDVVVGPELRPHRLRDRRAVTEPPESVRCAPRLLVVGRLQEVKVVSVGRPERTDRRLFEAVLVAREALGSLRVDPGEVDERDGIARGPEATLRVHVQVAVREVPVGEVVAGGPEDRHVREQPRDEVDPPLIGEVPGVRVHAGPHVRAGVPTSGATRGAAGGARSR